MTYQQAHLHALVIYDHLFLYCHRIHIAGSIRRGESICNDIEIVCEPRRQYQQISLFGPPDSIHCDEFVAMVGRLAEKVIKGGPQGRYMQFENKGVKVDLFMPEPADYYRQLAIRTGNADYSARVLAAAWRKKGWVGAGYYGLRRESDCTQTKDGKWTLVNFNGERPPVWESEEAFFEWLGVPWKEASARWL